MLLALAALLGWLLGSESGLQALAGRLPALTDHAVTITQPRGRLWGRLDLGQFTYDDGQGTHVQIRQLHLRWRPLALLRGQLLVLSLQTGPSQIALTSTPSSPATAQPFELPRTLPLDLRIDQAKLGPVDLRQDGQPLLQTRQLDLAGSWIGDQLKLASLELDAEPGHASLHGQLRLGSVIHGQLHAEGLWQLGQQRVAASIDATAPDKTAHLAIHLRTPTEADLQLNLEQTGHHLWQAALTAPSVTLASLGLDGPIKQLGLHLQASGNDQHGQAQAQLDLDHIPVLIDPLSLDYQATLQHLEIKQLHVHSPKLPGSVDLQGLVDLGGHEPNGQLTLGWKGLSLPAAWMGQPMNSSGQLQFRGSASQFAGAAQLELGPPGRLAQLKLDIQGTPRQLLIQQLVIDQPDRTGQLQLSGQIGLQAATAWKLQLAARNFDPGVWLHDWPGALNLQIDSEGQLGATLPVARLDLKQMDGRLRGRSIKGFGQLQLNAQQVLSGQLQLTSGQSSIRLEGQPGNSNQWQFKLSAPQAGDWLPDAKGRLTATATYLGKLRSGHLRLHVDGGGLQYAAYQLGRIDVDAELPDISQIGGTLDLDAAHAVVPGMRFDQIALKADGTASSHQLKLQLNGAPLSARLQLHGSYRQSQWQGQLAELELDLQGLPRWTLLKPVDLRYAGSAFSSSELCLSSGVPRICAGARQTGQGGLDASYRLQAIPISMLLNAAGMADVPVSISGNIDGEGTIHRSTSGLLTGTAAIRAPGGQIHYLEQPDQPLIHYSAINLQANLQPALQQLDLQAHFTDQSQPAKQGSIEGKITLQPSSQALGGQLSFALPSLNFASILSPQLAAVHGHAEGQLQLGGTLPHPTLIGNASLQDFAAELPAAGIKLEQGQFSIAVRNNNQAVLQGQLKSGAGVLHFNGQLGLETGAGSHLQIEGSQFTAADIPAAKVVISPSLNLDYLPSGLKLGGKIQLDSASVDLSQLPGGGAQQASSDVVVVGASPAPEDAGLPISASVVVDMGSHTELHGMGMDGHLGGQITVTQAPGGNPVGQGQITVDGSYKAYGQNLSIEQGHVLFASTPLDNPGLNIKAMRKINTNQTVDDGQQVGLLITGTAQKPVIDLYSNPAMDQSDTLAYLTTGKPLSQLNGSETNMVNSAAQAMGSLAGNYLAKHVGSKLGIDDIGVSSSDALDGNSAFTVGKYLTPRLYLSYGIALFESGQVVTLRYRISRRWNVEAQSATEYSRTSLNYRLER
ncbi:translocation/assembly module TamB domain-containing protein [Frateuria aurantia]